MPIIAENNILCQKKGGAQEEFLKSYFPRIERGEISILQTSKEVAFSTFYVANRYRDYSIDKNTKMLYESLLAKKKKKMRINPNLYIKYSFEFEALEQEGKLEIKKCKTDDGNIIVVKVRQGKGKGY